MAAKLFVGNLSFQATEEDLRELFAQAGTVETVRIITDQFTGRPRGFGFVEMATKEEATKAIEMLNGRLFRTGISSSMKLGLSRSAAPVGLAVTGARVRAAGPGAVEAGAARDRPGDVLLSPGFFLPYTTQQVTTMKIKPGVPAPGMR